MRLAQAARNLSITTDDIVTFLANNDIIIEKDSNTKLDDNSITLLFEYFDTGIPNNRKKESQIKKDELIEDSEINLADKNPSETAVVSESLEEEAIESKDEEIEKPENVNSFEEEHEESDLGEDIEHKELPATNLPKDADDTVAKEQENSGNLSKSQKYKTVADLLEKQEANEGDENVVIKAPKVSLQGLNVLGKIDLPEPKPKKEKEVTEPVRRESSKNRTPRKPAKRNSGRELTPQQIREREKKIALRRREEAERKAKKKREQFYKENILKPQQEQQKKKKPKKKKELNNNYHQEPKRPVPKTILGKFWRWLNT